MFLGVTVIHCIVCCSIVAEAPKHSLQSWPAHFELEASSTGMDPPSVC